MKYLVLILVLTSIHCNQAQELQEIKNRNQKLKEFVSNNSITKIVFTSNSDSYHQMKSQNYVDTIVYQYPSSYSRTVFHADGKQLNEVVKGGEYFMGLNGNLSKYRLPKTFQREDFF